MRKDPAAVKLAGKRMSKLSSSHRQEIARRAARARWSRRSAAGKSAGVPTIEEIAAQRADRVPDEEWNHLPADFLHQLDHYLYGLPKR